tara:strand:+ start:3566 stop:4633 length:1068 start_codon:yes stop_codon:yes gene_type:complete
MRVLQLIDTLRPGGAEKMAVSYANLLSKKGISSYLCCTREEGELKSQINLEVEYLFLEKRRTLDIVALKKLRRFIINNKIDIVQAHSSSFFFASLLRCSRTQFKLVWHDHYGESDLLDNRKTFLLKYFSKYFNGIISVNEKLKSWAIFNLKANNVVFINNFISDQNAISSPVKLNGNKESFKIICVANLRPQKDQLNLIRSFELVSEKIEASLHLIGQNPNTIYSKKILNHISNSKFKEKIFYYGTQMDVMGYLKQADLGVLASISEGLPVALLEYGVAGIPVVVTEVGQCKKVVQNLGLVIPPDNNNLLCLAILEYYNNAHRRLKDASNFQDHVLMEYGEDVIYKKIIEFYNTI